MQLKKLNNFKTYRQFSSIPIAINFRYTVSHLKSITFPYRSQTGSRTDGNGIEQLSTKSKYPAVLSLLKKMIILIVLYLVVPPKNNT